MSQKEPLIRRNSLAYDLIMLLVKIGAIALGLIVVFSFIFGTMRVSDPNMKPSFQDGDLVFFYRIDKRLAARDVVVYERNGFATLGRVVAVGGDTVNIDSRGLSGNALFLLVCSVHNQAPRVDVHRVASHGDNTSRGQKPVVLENRYVPCRVAFVQSVEENEVSVLKTGLHAGVAYAHCSKDEREHGDHAQCNGSDFHQQHDEVVREGVATYERLLLAHRILTPSKVSHFRFAQCSTGKTIDAICLEVKVNRLPGRVLQMPLA